MDITELIRILKMIPCPHSTPIDQNDKTFAYDYNEVQELFFDSSANHYIILTGKTGLRKKDMILKVREELLSCGKCPDQMLLLDYDLPILHGINPIDLFSESQIPNYLFINEIEMIGDWESFITILHEKYPTIKLLSTSSTPPFIFESIHEHNMDFCKTIVLSEKNQSNIKSDTQTFGTFDEFKFNIKDGIVEIKGLTKEGKKRTVHRIPPSIKGKPVRIIASGAFHDRGEMTDISIPEGVTMIGDYAFTKCTSLKTIKLPDSLQYIGDHSFFGDRSLETIDGGNNIKHIGNSALYGTAWLSKQNDFATIGNVLYKYVGKSTNVELPDKVEVLGPYSFSETDIQSVHGNNITTVEEGTFYGCKKLQKIPFQSDCVPAFCYMNCSSMGGHVDCETADKYSFYGTSVSSVSCNTAYACSFANCQSIKKADNLKRIETGSFWNNNVLETIDLSNAEFIGMMAISNTKMNCIKTNNCEILEYAFLHNELLTEVIIHTGCNVHPLSLYDCENVSTMYIDGKMKIEAYFGKKPLNLKQLEIHGDLCDNICRDCHSLEKLILRDVKTFGRWTFYKNINLKNIELDKVTSLGDWSFAYCESLNTIVLPKELILLGMNSFRYCRNLRNIIIESNSMITFGPNAFYSTHPEKIISVNKEMIEKYRESELWSEYITSIQCK